MCLANCGASEAVYSMDANLPTKRGLDTDLGTKPHRKTDKNLIRTIYATTLLLPLKVLPVYMYCTISSLKHVLPYLFSRTFL